MKIGIVIEHFDETRGGAEKLAVWVARGMVARGHEVHVVCHDVATRIGRYRQATLRASFDAERSRRAHGGGGNDELRMTNDESKREDRSQKEEGGSTGGGRQDACDTGGSLHVHRLKGMRLNTALGFRLFGVRARRWFREHPVDVVHSFSVAYPGDVYQAYAGVYAAMQAQAAASRGTEARAVWKKVLLRLPGKQRTLLAMEQEALEGRRAARLVIGGCEMIARGVRAFYPGAEGKVVVMEVPIIEEGSQKTEDRRERAEVRAWFRGHYGVGAGERVAVFVGHDFRRKGLRYAIEAVARTRGWKLMVVGQGKVREYVELAEALGVGVGGNDELRMTNDESNSNEGNEEMTKGGGGGGRQDACGTAGRGARVMFLGPTGEMGWVYGVADALILPAFYEASGMVVREALGAGLPVVSTGNLGMSGVVAEKGVGVIVASPRDVEGLARGLEGLPAEGSRAWEEMRGRAREAGAGVSGEGYLGALEEVWRGVRGRGK